MNIIDATIKALMNGLKENKSSKNEAINDSLLNATKIKDWVKKSIDWLVEQDAGCCEYKLDNDLSIFCGWSDGYDPEDDDGIKPKEDLTFRINVGIKSNHEYMKTDYDWLVAPYDDKTGEVWDTDITVAPDGIDNSDAKWLIDQYKEIRKALDSGEVILENYDDEDSRFSKCDVNDLDDRYPENIRNMYCDYVEDLASEEPIEFIEWVEVNYPDIYNEIENYDLDESKIKKVEREKGDGAGICPKCGSDDLDYDSFDISDGFGDDCFYPWHCDNCDTDGKECYKLEYNSTIAHTYDGDIEGNDEGVCPECGGQIQYGMSDIMDTQLAYEYTCEDCGSQGYEYYDMVFVGQAIDEDTLKEARSHKEDNEKVAPRQSTNLNDVDKVNKYSWKYAGREDGVGRDINGNIVGRDIKRNRVRSTTQAANRKNAGALDNAGMTDMQDYEELPNQDSSEYKALRKNAKFVKWADKYNKEADDILIKRGIKQENKKITEATLDLDDMYDEYKKAYGIDLDIKKVPCVIARDTMLSGWGGAEGKNHYQVVLCYDSTEAYNIKSNMQAKAKQEQLANVRISFGIQLPRNASVAYTVGRYAPAWNLGDYWYDNKFGSEDKVEEAKNDFEVKCIKTYFENDEEYWSEGNYYQAKKLLDNNWKVKTNLGTWGRIGDAYTIDDINEYFEVQDKVEETKNNKEVSEIEKRISSKLKAYKQLKKVSKGDTNKSKDLEDEIEDLEAKLKSLKSEAIDYKNDRINVTTAEDTADERDYYGKNMTKRDKVRSLDQAKRNLDRIGKDPRVTQGQAVDQLSYENTTDNDLDLYKARKDYAGIYRGEGPRYNKDLTINGKSKLEPTDVHLETADMWDKDAKDIANKIRAKHRKQEAISPELYNKIKNEPKSEKYNKGLKLRDEIVDAWKNKDLKTAYEKWSDLFDLFSTGYDDNGNVTDDWSEEQSLRDNIELTSITDTIEDKCVYDVTDYGKIKVYNEMGY